MEKTEILNIDTPLKEKRELKALFPFTWREKGLKYLGVYLSVITELYQDNYIPLLNKIKQDLKGYQAYRLSWLGRINVIKMMTLPKALYIFQSLPICIPGA